MIILSLTMASPPYTCAFWSLSSGVGMNVRHLAITNHHRAAHGIDHMVRAGIDGDQILFLAPVSFKQLAKSCQPVKKPGLDLLAYRSLVFTTLGKLELPSVV